MIVLEEINKYIFQFVDKLTVVNILSWFIDSGTEEGNNIFSQIHAVVSGSAGNISYVSVVRTPLGHYKSTNVKPSRPHYWTCQTLRALGDIGLLDVSYRWFSHR